MSIDEDRGVRGANHPFTKNGDRSPASHGARASVGLRTRSGHRDACARAIHLLGWIVDW